MQALRSPSSAQARRAALVALLRDVLNDMDENTSVQELTSPGSAAGAVDSGAGSGVGASSDQQPYGQTELAPPVAETGVPIKGGCAWNIAQRYQRSTLRKVSVSIGAAHVRKRLLGVAGLPGHPFLFPPLSTLSTLTQQ